jgi:hypothetical protein
MSENEMNLFRAMINYATLYVTTQEGQQLDARMRNSIMGDIQSGEQILAKYKKLKPTLTVVPAGGENEV